MNFIRQQYLRIFRRGRFGNKRAGSTTRRDQNVEFAAVATENVDFELEDFMDLKKVTYSDVENIEQATALIESCEDLKNMENVLFLTVQLDDPSGSIDAQKLAQKCKGNSMVVFLESKAVKKFSILWKLKDVESFFVFGHYSMAFDETDRQVYKFIADFLAKSLTRRHLGINTACKNENVLLTDISDYRGFSLLLIAIEQNNTEMAKTLLNLGASAESLDGSVTAQSLAWNLRNSELLLQMAKFNMKYPAGLILSELSEDFQAFYKETEELHSAIKAEDKEKIEQVLKSCLHKHRFYFNLDNESAASVAIKQGSDDIYEILLRHDVFLAEDGLLLELTDDYQRTVRELHTKYKKESEDKHINILYSRSHAAHDAMDAQGNMIHVRKAYELMAQNPLLNVILKVVAAVRRFDIIYDFSRDATNVVDPTTAENSEGVFYPGGQIFIGAKQLLDERNKFQAICVVAHELCHFACNIMYKNDAQPFAKDDDETREWFNEINAKCKASKDKDEVVRLVYDYYPPDMFMAELIVRAPHMLALYIDQPEKQRECRASYPDLFDFYETHLVPKMEKAIPEIKAKAEREIEEKDMKIFKYKFLWFISIILAIVGVIATAFIVRAIFFKPEYAFNALDDIQQQKVWNGSIIYKGVKLKLHDLFPKDSLAYQNLTSDHITQIFDEKTLNFSSPYLGYLDSQVEHNWQNMSEQLKEKVLNSHFTFQNESLPLVELNNSVPNVFMSLTSEEIVEIFDGNLVIGMMIANETNFYVERKLHLVPKEFTRKDLNLTWDEWQNLNIDGSIREKVTNHTRKKLILLNLITNNTEWKFTTNCYTCFEVDIYYAMSDVIETTQLSRFFILSDEAGSGKSVTFQQIAMNVKKRFPDHWVSYFDLKDYTRFYDKEKISNDPFIVLKEILDLKSKSEFELKIFEDLFKMGKVVFFWDGFDEISPAFSNEVLGLMKFVNENSKNVQYVCTRPIYAEILVKSFKIASKKLTPYTKFEQEEFLGKYFMSKKVNKIEIANLIEKVLKISTELKYRTPLMLMLIAGVHEELKNVESLNLYKIYETFVKKKIKVWREKSETNKNIADNLIAKNINVNKIYQKYAIRKEIFSHNLPRLKIMKTKIPKGLNHNEISRMGILYINAESIFDFSHKTFGEFFVAQYLVENVLELDDDEPFEEIIFDFFYTVEMSPMTISFLTAYIKDQKFNGTGHFHPEIEKLLRQKYKNYFFSILLGHENDYFDTFKVFLLMLNKNHQLLVDMLHVNENETVYTAYFNPSWSDRSRYNRITSEEVINVTAEFLTDNELSKYLIGKNQKGIILYGIARSVLEKIPKYHPSYSLGDVNVTEDYVKNFYKNVRKNLSEMEQKHLLVTILSYPFYYIRKESSWRSLSLDHYEKMWKENLLGKEDIISIIGEILDHKNKLYFKGYSNFSDFISDRVKESLSSFELFGLFMAKQLCLKPFIENDWRYKGINFEKLWNLLSSLVDKEQQKTIILQELKIGGNEILEFRPTALFYEKNRIKLFHFLLLRKFATKLSFSLSHWFSETEQRKIISTSNEFMLTIIKDFSYSDIKEFFESLEKLFVGYERDLIEFLKRKISGTDHTIFSYFDIFLSSYREDEKEKFNKIQSDVEELIERLKRLNSQE